MSLFEDLIATFAEKFKPHEDGAQLPSHHDNCLGCGQDNPHGHHLQACRAGDAVVAHHTFDQRHEGAPGIAHGGALATVVDDLYGFLQYLVGGPAVTRHLEIDYLAPVVLGIEYELEAHLVDHDQRKLHVAASIAAPDGRPVLSSTAVFILVDVEHFSAARGAANL